MFKHDKIEGAHLKYIEERRDASIARRKQKGSSKGKGKPFVCFKWVNTGKCDNPECKYLHDDQPRQRVGKDGDGAPRDSKGES